ncbi:hypothetical protein SEVIR_3G216950v4 [Setaria viridis]
MKVPDSRREGAAAAVITDGGVILVRFGWVASVAWATEATVRHGRGSGRRPTAAPRRAVDEVGLVDLATSAGAARNSVARFVRSFPGDAADLAPFTRLARRPIDETAYSPRVRSILQAGPRADRDTEVEFMTRQCLHFRRIDSGSRAWNPRYNNNFDLGTANIHCSLAG